MSFLQDLANRKGAASSPTARPVPISLPDAMSGLAGTVREPYRINAPLNGQFTPTNRQTLEQRGVSFRG